MRYEERKKSILVMLDTNETLTVRQVSEALAISEATVRRDFVRMERNGELRRTWGGVSRIETPENARKRALEHRCPGPEHEVMGRIAASYVQEGDTIFVGAGISTLAMIQFIKAPNIYAVTNGIPQLEALNRAGVNTLLLCGFFREYSRSLVGVETVEMLRRYHFDRAFLGAHGLDSELNILSGDSREAELKFCALSCSTESYLMLGHDKFDRTAFYTTSRDQAADMLVITDRPGIASPSWEAVYGGYVSRLGDLTRIE